jgi:hypothetical protein
MELNGTKVHQITPTHTNSHQNMKRINTLNGNIQQQNAINSLDLPIQKVLQKLSPKDRDGVMKRFNELNREAEKKIKRN